MLPLLRLTPRLTVRPLVPADREAWIAGILASAEMHAPWAPTRGPDWTPAREWEALLAKLGDGSARFVGVAADGRIAAWVNLNQVIRGPTLGASAGWSVNAEFAGAGYATEAVTALLDLAFLPEPAGLGLHRVAAGIMPENARSLRVAEKCGFRREGFAPKLVKIAGEWRDHVLVAKLAEEHPVCPIWDAPDHV